jgi:arginase
MTKPIMRIIGIPMDLGQKRRGVDMGPSAIRYAGLQEKLTAIGFHPNDCGNLTVPQAEQMESPFHSDKSIGRAHYLPQVAEVCQQTYEYTRFCVKSGDRVIFLGGDHSLAIGTISAMAQDGPIGVIWVDAHADINTPHTTPSGNIHGMPVAVLLGDGAPPLVNIGYDGPKLKPAQMAMVGLRDLDDPERERLSHGDILAYTMRAVDEHGVSHVTARILDRFAAFKHTHVSFDLDSLDPSIAPGVGTPEPGGLTIREAHLLMEILADSGKVRSMDIVETNPILDQRNTTAEVAVALAASLFGKRIL